MARSNSKAVLMAGACFCAAVPGTVFAQQADAPADAAMVGEVVVTAQRREQRLQDVPVAVSAYGEQQLLERRIDTLSDLQRIEPSLTLRSGQDEEGSSFTIRGVGTQVFSIGVEPSVSFLVDNVVLGRQAAAFVDLIDIERVEVLRGPQGTLFGKNASAGVINILTQRPDDEFGGVAEVVFAEDNELIARASVTGPITDQLGFRLTGFHKERDGYILNRFNGQLINDDKSYGARAKLEFDDGQGFNFLVIADYRKSERICCAPQPRKFADSPAAAALFATFIAPVVPSETNTETNINTPVFADTEQYGLSGEATVSLGRHTLTSITASRESNLQSDNDAELLPFTQARRGLTIVPTNGGANDQNQFTQEVRLASDFDSVQTVVGAFYFDQEITRDFRRTIFACGVAAPQGDVCPAAASLTIAQSYLSTVDTRNFAVFGDATWRVAEPVELFAGLRYTTEELEYDFIRINPLSPVAGSPSFIASGRADEQAVSGRIGGRYIFSDTISAYASYNRGFKGPGFDITTQVTPAQLAEQPVDPETADSYEIGLRSSFFDRRVDLNLTAFTTTYENFQAQSYNSELVSFVLQNAGTVETKGVELALNIRPVEALRINANAAYIDATIEEYPNGSCYAGQPRTPTATGALPPPLTCGNNGTPATGDDRQNLAGGRLPDSPEFKASLSTVYDLALPALPFDVVLQGAYTYQSDVQYSLVNNPRTVQDGYGVADASIALVDRNGRYRLTAFVRNLFDEKFVSAIFEAPGLGGNGGFAHLVPREADRYFGASLRVEF